MATIGQIDPSAPLYRIVAAVAEAICPTREDFICNVTKQGTHLPVSYKYNASLFGNKVLAYSPSFQEVSGHLSGAEIQIILYRLPRAQSARNTRPNSVLHLIRDALQQNKPIEISLSKIPLSWLARPEQLRYRIKLQFGRSPIIERFATKWIIS